MERITGSYSNRTAIAHGISDMQVSSNVRSQNYMTAPV